jgi:hypothetical protein
MGRHGRQQLLSPRRSGRSGQAIVELLPAVIVFFTVIVAALNYFRVMRAAVIRQEAVRNQVFAIINNSGTLTTPPNLLQDIKGIGTLQAGIEGYVPIIKDHSFIAGNSSCIIVYPPDVVANVETPLLSMFSSGSGTPSVNFMTYAVIHRQLGADCAR